MKKRPQNAYKNMAQSMGKKNIYAPEIISSKCWVHTTASGASNCHRYRNTAKDTATDTDTDMANVSVKTEM